MRVLSLRFALALALVGALVVDPAAVVAQRPGFDVDEGSGWPELFDPARRSARDLRRDGLVLLLRGLGRLDPGLGDAPSYVILDDALRRFERARQVTPDDPELAYYTAIALGAWRRGQPEEHRAEEAIDAWHRVREIDRSFAPERVAYELAMLHMRRHEFELARGEYEASLRWALPPAVELADVFYPANMVERRLASLFDPIGPANVHGNLAEVTMLTGDVRAAAVHYRAAMEMSADPFTRALAQWGLALALDRDGDGDGALAIAERAIREDPVPPDHPSFMRVHREHGAFAVLHLDFVFYEPPYEIHAYEAIGHEAYAQMEPEERAAHLARAQRSWRLFLAGGGTASRFAARAREHLAQIESELEPAPANPPSGRARRR